MKVTSSIVATALALATATSATYFTADENNGRIDWVSWDNVNRVIRCVPQAGQPEIDDIEVPGGATVPSYFPENWIGNCRGVSEGEVDPLNGMMVEMAWGQWQDMTFYDVSAICNETDVNNIKMMVPAQGEAPEAGCPDVGPGECDNLYRLWNDDLATKSTEENHFIVYLGTQTNSTTKSQRRGPVARSYADLSEEISSAENE